MFLLIGGCDKTLEAAEETDFLENIKKKMQKFDYDILVFNYLHILKEQTALVRTRPGMQSPCLRLILKFY
jgi:hypothetical protein